MAATTIKNPKLQEACSIANEAIDLVNSVADQDQPGTDVAEDLKELGQRLIAAADALAGEGTDSLAAGDVEPDMEPILAASEVRTALRGPARSFSESNLQSTRLAVRKFWDWADRLVNVARRTPADRRDALARRVRKQASVLGGLFARRFSEDEKPGALKMPETLKKEIMATVRHLNLAAGQIEKLAK